MQYFRQETVGEDDEGKVTIPCSELILGLAPRMARLTLALRPSMIGFGSLQARSAASFVAIITWNQKEMAMRKIVVSL